MSHWYTPTGDPLYQVPTADGTKLRDTTLRDAKKLKLVYSVTEIISLPRKMGLEVWKQNQLLDAAFEFKNLDKEKNQWSAIVLDKANKITTETAKKGHLIHDQLENYFDTGGCDEEYNAYVYPVVDKIKELVGDDLSSFIAEKSFAHEAGFGGKVDLYSQKLNIIIDFKTKNKDSLGWNKVKGYNENIMQLAAYSEGLRLKKPRLINIYISSIEPGLIKHKEWNLDETDKGLDMFIHLLEYCKLVNNYDSGF